MTETRELKMWIAVRTDLNISPGKIAVQAAHASGWLHLIAGRESPALFGDYLLHATPKIAVRVDSRDALLRVADEARTAGIHSYVVTDAGRSEVPTGTKTVCMFGPAYRDELPPYLKRLRMLGDESGCGLVDAKRQLLSENMKKALADCEPKTETEILLATILHLALHEGML